MTDAQTIDEIEVAEGWPKYSAKKNDPPTKGGITLDTLRLWRKDPTLTVSDLKQLERPEARAMYQFMFLQPFAAVRDEALRRYLVDLGVLRGPRTAAMVVQEIAGTPADGWIGPASVAALATLPPRQLLLMLIGARYVQIETHISEAPEDAEYRRGWRARNATFLPAST